MSLDVRERITPRTIEPLIDGCGRRIEHLRLSVTAACDLTCLYCRPHRHAELEPAADTLTDEQRLEFVWFLRERYGLTQVRLTGGEPLLYRNVTSLVASLKAAVPQMQLAMTTHGRLLSCRATALRRAGLQRLNISLDSLDPERYRRITGGPLADVLEGIESAKAAGFAPPRINTVVLREFNDDELCDLCEWAWSIGSEIRFLEAMPIGPVAEFNRKAFVPGREIRARLRERLDLEPISTHPGETARRFHARSSRAEGMLGLITPVSEPFCHGCRRMRLTAEGQLFPCLLDSRFVDLRAAWDGGRFAPAVADELIRRAVGEKKPKGTVQSVPMIQLGG